jgi:ubiquinone/menaquinone biosynthesis C-methylase UbiE
MDEMIAWDEQYRRKGEMWRGRAPLTFTFSPGERTLELGCGNGKTATALLDKGVIVIGIDHSIQALVQCGLSVPTLKGTLVQGDLRDLPFIDGCFDAVVCIHVLEHLTEEGRGTAIGDIFRILRPGGRLLFQAFSISDMRFGKGEELEERTYRRGDGISYHYFEDLEVELMFKAFHKVDMGHRSLRKSYHGQDIVRDVIRAEFVKRA